MAGNSKRKGAIRKSSKGPLVGSGGRGKQKLEGRGPTPKAEERTKHPAAKRKRLAEKAAAKQGRSTPSKRVSRPRDRDGIEWVAGRNSVLECLRANIPASALYVQQYVETDDRLKEILTLANTQDMSLLEAPRGELDRMTDGAVHQGVALRIPAYEYALPEDIFADAIANKVQPFIVALDGVTDPRNLGAVIRSAAAFGADGVVVPERRAAGMTASAWKTSAGAATRVPVARATNLTRTLLAYRKAGCSIIGLDADGDIELTDFSADIASGPIVLVIGGEATGMSRLVRESCDSVVSIAMYDETESLNAGVAAGIAMYEIARLRQV